MGEIVDRADSKAFAGHEGAALERRLLRAMYAVIALAVVVSALIAPWRVTSGLLLGGALALFNHRWLTGSLAAVFGSASQGKRARLSAARYVLRYLIIACVVAAAAMLNLISVPATLAGLCAFAAAVMIEAFTQLYFAIIHREDF